MPPRLNLNIRVRILAIRVQNHGTMLSQGYIQAFETNILTKISSMQIAGLGTRGSGTCGTGTAVLGHAELGQRFWDRHYKDSGTGTCGTGTVFVIVCMERM